MRKIHELAFSVSAASFSFSIPTNDMAIFLNRLLTLCPAFADVSMNMMFSSVARAFASSRVTCLCTRYMSMSYTDGMYGNVPFVGEIGFVTDKDYNYVVPPL